MPSHLRAIAAAFLAATIFAIAAAVVHAANGDPGFGAANWVATGYAPDKQKAAWVSGQGMASATSIATLTSTVTGQFIVGGRSSISVGGRFDTVGQTCKIRLLYEYSSTTTTLTDVNAVPTNLSFPLTLTGTSFTDAAGKFVASPVFFDSLGATHVYLVIDTPPAANQVALWVGSS